MTPGASTGRARSQSQTSRRRSQARRRAAEDRKRRRQVTRRRKSFLVAAALTAIVVGAVVLVGSEKVQDKIREVTLPLRHEDIIRQQAEEKEVPAELIAAIIYAESRFRDQESHAGARGLMQVTPQTAELIESLSGGSTFVADDLSDPDINIRYGTFYLNYLLDKFDEQPGRGPRRVQRRRDQRRLLGRLRPGGGGHPLRGDAGVRGRACSRSGTSTASTTPTSWDWTSAPFRSALGAGAPRLGRDEEPEAGEVVFAALCALALAAAVAAGPAAAGAGAKPRAGKSVIGGTWPRSPTGPGRPRSPARGACTAAAP